MDFVAHVSPNMYIYLCISFDRSFVIITKAMNILDCLKSGHGNLFGSSFERLLFARNSQNWLCFCAGVRMVCKPVNQIDAWNQKFYQL